MKNSTPSKSLNRRARILASLALALSSSAFAGLLNDFEDIEGKTVIYAGDIQQLYCPIGGKYDCLKWPSNFYKTSKGLQEICFVASGYPACGYSCKGMIAVGTDRQKYVFLIESFGSIKKSSIETYNCPSMF